MYHTGRWKPHSINTSVAPSALPPAPEEHVNSSNSSEGSTPASREILFVPAIKFVGYIVVMVAFNEIADL